MKWVIQDYKLLLDEEFEHEWAVNVERCYGGWNWRIIELHGSVNESSDNASSIYDGMDKIFKSPLEAQREAIRCFKLLAKVKR